mmetsp:Transcript_76256/g.203926  ORF Transcript_76256/g.203926 Transcript_76256/m.203926 type:complete len:248 (-) Transcript_76256:1232-1975(-)
MCDIRTQVLDGFMRLSKSDVAEVELLLQRRNLDTLFSYAGFEVGAGVLRGALVLLAAALCSVQLTTQLRRHRSSTAEAVLQDLDVVFQRSLLSFAALDLVAQDRLFALEILLQLRHPDFQHLLLVSGQRRHLAKGPKSHPRSVLHVHRHGLLQSACELGALNLQGQYGLALVSHFCFGLRVGLQGRSQEPPVVVLGLLRSQHPLLFSLQELPFQQQLSCHSAARRKRCVAVHSPPLKLPTLRLQLGR